LEGRDVRRLKAVEEENARLKRLVAAQAVDTQALQELLRKNW
jgi:putative transposase